MSTLPRKRIHFIGIGGIGMSALARFWHHEGAEVTGSDRSSSIVTEGLEDLGITIFYEQKAENISSKQDLELVVYTEAMSEDHPEMQAARALGVPMVNYFEALGQVANEYYLIAVAGSHGKTTTTTMLADILEAADLDPTVVVGSLRAKTGSNFRAGKSKYAVVEACEYKRDFLHLRPDVLVITNIEFEHVDYYKDLADVQSAFRQFALQVAEGGAVVANVNDPNVAPVVADLPISVIDYRSHIDLSLRLRQPGLHNRLNAAAASGVARFLQIESGTTRAALEEFAGTWRRFEYKGEVNGAVVYDDYAHHPTEIAATIAGVKELYAEKKLLIVFQSHTYSRTNQLLTDFIEALAKADEVILLPIYAAREENHSGITSDTIATGLIELGTPARVAGDTKTAALWATESSNDGSVIVVMGAGPVTEVASILTK